MIGSTLFFDFKKETVICDQCQSVQAFHEVVIHQCPSCLDLNYFCDQCQLSHSIPSVLIRRIIMNKNILVTNSIKKNNYETIVRFRNKIPKKHRY